MKILSQILILFLSLSYSAQAYIWPSEFLVEQVAKKKSARTVKISSVISEMQGGQPTSTRIQEVLWVDYARGVYQSRIYNSSGKEIFFRSGRVRDPHSALGVPSQTDSQAPGTFLTIERSEDALLTFLLKKDLPVLVEGQLLALPDEDARRKAEETEIKRWNEEQVWVIGNREKNKEQTELWLRKNEFLPLRFFWSGTELRFVNYYFSNGFHYPQEILVMKDEEPFLQAKMQPSRLEVNSKNFRWPKASREGWTEEGRSEGSSTQDLVRLFYQTIR